MRERPLTIQREEDALKKALPENRPPAQAKPREPLHVILSRIYANLEARKVAR